MFDFIPNPILIQLGPITDRLVRHRLRDRPRRRLHGHGPARPASRRGRRDPRQRDDHRRGRGAHRRAALPRHRPVGAVQGRPAQDRPAAVLGPRRLRRDRRPGSSRPSCTPATSGSRSCAGRTSSPRPVRDAGDRALGQLLQPGAVRVADDAAVGDPDRVRSIGSADLACSAYPFETTRFHPLFLYESISGVLGALVLIWIGFRLRKRLRPGDLFLVFLIWYGVVRFSLETLRHANWTFDGFAVAQIVSLMFIVPALLILAWRHRPNHPDDDPPTFPAIATWGAPGRAVDFEPVPESEAAADADRTSDARPRSGADRLTVADPDGPDAPRRVAEARTSPGSPGRCPRRRPGRARLARPRTRVEGEPPGPCPGRPRPARPVRGVPVQGRTAGRERLPVGGGYLLVAAIHRGWMDPFLDHARPAARASGLVPRQRPVGVQREVARVAAPSGRRDAARLARRRRCRAARRFGAGGPRQRRRVRPGAGRRRRPVRRTGSPHSGSGPR